MMSAEEEFRKWIESVKAWKIKYKCTEPTIYFLHLPWFEKDPRQGRNVTTPFILPALMTSDQEEEEEFLKWIESVKAWKIKYKYVSYYISPHPSISSMCRIRGGLHSDGIMTLLLSITGIYNVSI
ncbi:uncharacterized protein LOC143781406 [Ranitomeya variabilis]|uniref:uncharacterized protein LOC143781406 n=1 Tax=Ranitomeya variabilis TaxID=490064 RepID=UPI00405730B7